MRKLTEREEKGPCFLSTSLETQEDTGLPGPWGWLMPPSSWKPCLTGLFHPPLKSLPPPPQERTRPLKPPAPTVHLTYLTLALVFVQLKPSSALAGCVAWATLNGTFFICFTGT